MPIIAIILLTSNTLTVIMFTINAFTGSVSFGDVSVSMTRKELGIFSFLLDNANSVVDRNAISHAVWDKPYDPTTNVIDVTINYVRAKLGKIGAADTLVTVRGQGYMMVVPTDATN